MRKKNEIPVLEKVIEILEYIGAHPSKVTQPELQDNLNIPQATCYRIMSTLVAHNWLTKNNNNHYDISTGMLSIAKKVMFQIEKYRVLQPILESLSKKVGYSSKLSILDGFEQVNVLCAKAPWDIALTAVIGSRDNLANGGSVGITLLSGISTKKRNDYLLKNEADLTLFQQKIDSLRENGFIFNPASVTSSVKWHVDALSVPILSEKGKITGALTILSLPGELAKADWEKLAKEMHKTAEFCSNIMV